MSKKKTVEMGDEAKDSVTGFKGIVTGMADYLTGCRQFLVAPKVDKEGKVQDGHWFDVDRLTVVKKAVVKQTGRPEIGGPRTDAPTKRH